MNSQRRRNNNSQRRTSRAAGLSVETKQLDVLERTYQLEKTQQRGLVERVSDVPRLRIKRDKVYTFVRAFDAGMIVNSVTAPIAFANAPSLSSLPVSGDVTDNWEQWRFTQITWSFIPMTTGTVQNPFYTWFDQDDDTLPPNINEPLQSETMRISALGSFIERTVTPQVSMSGTATGSATSGYVAPGNNLWCDEAYPATKYYGIKAFSPANTNLGASVPLYQVMASVVVQVRRPK